MFMFRTAAVLAAAALLAGCAAPLRVTFTPEQKASIAELDVKVVVVQDEVIVDIKPPNSATAGMMFGVIGALVTTTIDSAVTNSRVKAAQDVMGPFYAAIDDVDFRKDLDEAIRPGLASYPIKLGSVTTTPVVFTNAKLRQWRDGLRPGQGLLIVVPRYLMSADFRTLDVETWVTIWKKEGDDRPINRGVLRFQSAPVGPGEAESVALWSAKQGAVFRATVKEAITETLLLARTDMSVPDKSEATDNLRDFALQQNGITSTVRGKLIAEAPNRVVVLGADGRLYSLPKATTPAVPGKV